MSRPYVRSFTPSYNTSYPDERTPPRLGLLFDTFQNLLSSLADLFNTYLPPSRRQAWSQSIAQFANSHPRLTSFLLTQLLLSFPPLLLFLFTTVTVVVCSLMTGILLGLMGALLFIMFALGFALVILLPVLFFTTATAMGLWFWGMVVFTGVKWWREREGKRVAGDGMAEGGVEGGSSEARVSNDEKDKLEGAVAVNATGKNEATEGNEAIDLPGVNGEVAEEEKGKLGGEVTSNGSTWQTLEDEERKNEPPTQLHHEPLLRRADHAVATP